MLQFYGTQPPAALNTLRCGGTCPHCGRTASFTRMLDLIENVAKSLRVTEVMITYHCDACMRAIPVLYDIIDWDPTRVQHPRIAIPVMPSLDVSHVTSGVAEEIREALACHSVGAFNGFASVCRRVTRAILEDLGDDVAPRITAHLTDMISVSGLGDEWDQLARQTLGPPQGEADQGVPAMDAERAAVVLSILRDLVYQLYTRPGAVRGAAGGGAPRSGG